MVKHSEVAVRPDSVAVEFDDERLVANAGVMLTSTLINRLGLERLVDQMVDLGQRAGAAKPGRKVCSLVHAMALGADSIDDCDVLRAGGTEALLGHRVMAPSTLGTFLRSFSFGHVRQLDRVLAESIRRAWSAGAGPGGERLVIDLDSFVGEVHGSEKQGAGFGYTGERGYHPILATRSGTGEVLHVRLRKGQAGSGRGALRFVQELVARVRRAGATGEILIRADSAFWNKKVLAYLAEKGCRYSVAVTMHRVVAERIALIAERREPETGVFEIPVVGRIHFVVAEVRFFNLGGSINGRQTAAGCDAQFAGTGEFWSAVAAIGNRAHNRGDDEILRAATVLRRIRVGDSGYVAGIL